MSFKDREKFKNIILKNIGVIQELNTKRQDEINNLLQDDKYGVIKFLLDSTKIQSLDYDIRAMIVTKDSVLSRDGRRSDFHRTLHLDMVPEINEHMEEGQHTAVGITNMGYVSINLSSRDCTYIFLPEELNDYQIQVLKDISNCIKRIYDSGLTPYVFEVLVSSPKMAGDSMNLDEALELYTGKVKG